MCGLHPKFVVCDQDSSHRKAFTLFNITTAHPYIEVNGEKIFFFYDTPHLIKSTRNTLNKYNIQVEGEMARWSHIEEFYAKDKLNEIRIAPKLTETHVDFNNFEKMKVKYATQIFSRTVASGIYLNARLGGLPPEAIGTAKFIKNLNDIFHVFNSSTKNHYEDRKASISRDNSNI